MTAPDVLVAGAGIVGLSVAHALAGRGMRVAVVTRDEPGSGASAAAAGMLETHYPAPMPEALARLAVRSRALYPGWVRALREETGFALALEETGSLVVAETDGEMAELRGQHARIPESRLHEDEADWRRLEPRLRPGLKGVLELPLDHHVDPVRLCGALVRALERRRVAVRRGVTVDGVAVRGGRVEGLDTDAGRLAARSVVLAPGAWAGSLRGLPAPLPVRPVKGQLVVLETDELPSRVLQGRNVYLVPRSRDRRVLLGATVEEAGFDVRPTAAAVESLLAAGRALCPETAGARFAGVRVGLRPGTPDGLPILGRGAVEGLAIAAGHFRKGVLLAPLTASHLAGLLAGDDVEDLPACSPSRFAHARVG